MAFAGYYAPTDDCITAVYITGSRDNSGSTYYLIKDYLGSVMIFINKYGETIESHNYDPWGNLRNSIDFTSNDINTGFIVNMGFTGHEYLPEFGLINMNFAIKRGQWENIIFSLPSGSKISEANGRMYDPVINRMLSPDNFVQDPTNFDNYNRYSYCLNNPLKYIDPSGEFIFTSLATLFCPPLTFLGVMLDGACLSGVINAGTQGIMIATGNQANFNWAQFGGAMVSGAVFGGMGMLSPAFNVTSTRFATNLPTYLSKAGYATLTGAVTVGTGMLATDLFDNGKIDTVLSDYLKGMGIVALTSGLLSFGSSMVDYMAWDRYELQYLDEYGILDLSKKSKMSILNDKFGEICYDPDLRLDWNGRFNKDELSAYIGPSGMKSKSQAFTTAKHERFHLKDWTTSKRPYKRYFGRTFIDQFEIRAHRHAIRGFNTDPKIWINNIKTMNKVYDFKGIVYSFGPGKFWNFFY